MSEDIDATLRSNPLAHGLLAPRWGLVLSVRFELTGLVRPTELVVTTPRAAIVLVGYDDIVDDAVRRFAALKVKKQ